MATVSTPTVREKPFYIESDGKPMGETQKHVLNMRYLLEPLDKWFASDPMVYVAGNMFVHYEQGNRNRHLSPDVFVVRGVPKKPERRNYRVWEEGRAPDFVVEFTSESTREEDQTINARFTRTFSACRSIFFSILSRNTYTRRFRVIGWWAAAIDRSSRSEAVCRARYLGCTWKPPANCCDYITQPRADGWRRHRRSRKPDSARGGTSGGGESPATSRG